MKQITKCVGKCSLNPIEHYCMGCFRSLKDISCWKLYSKEKREIILKEKRYFNNEK